MPNINRKLYIEDTYSLAKELRKKVLAMIFKAKASHIGSNLSLVDILAVLYGKILNIDPHNPKMPDRDRIIISKGHAAAVLYSILAECGFLTREYLNTYGDNGSLLLGHVSHFVSGVEFSSGSLGHGLSVGAGLALAGKREGALYKVYVVLSDGELNEGSTWEAMLFAAQHGLDNLVVVLDYNRLQGFGAIQNIIELEPILDKWKACNWAVQQIDGHNHEELFNTFNNLPFICGRPSVIVACTVKGKGVSFMENKLEWHYKSPTEEQFMSALSELNKT